MAKLYEASRLGVQAGRVGVGVLSGDIVHGLRTHCGGLNLVVFEKWDITRLGWWYYVVNAPPEKASDTKL